MTTVLTNYAMLPPVQIFLPVDIQGWNFFNEKQGYESAKRSSPNTFSFWLL
jgi:hypothetical protein